MESFRAFSSLSADFLSALPNRDDEFVLAEASSNDSESEGKEKFYRGKASLWPLQRESAIDVALVERDFDVSAGV